MQYSQLFIRHYANCSPERICHRLTVVKIDYYCGEKTTVKTKAYSVSVNTDVYSREIRGEIILGLSAVRHKTVLITNTIINPVFWVISPRRLEHVLLHLLILETSERLLVSSINSDLTFVVIVLLSTVYIFNRCFFMIMRWTSCPWLLRRVEFVINISIL